MACASDKLNKSDQKDSCVGLNCPICLEVYNSPKVLSCLHTFCQGCLQSYINKQTEKEPDTTVIECPLCRTKTDPPTSISPAEWAKNLHTNYALIPLLESVVIENESTNNCDPCRRLDTNVKAESFCADCQEYQCKTCVLDHSKFSQMKDHNIVKIEGTAKDKMGSLNLGKVEYCHLHPNKKIKYYCNDHAELCCSACAIVGHRPCQNVMEASELGRGMKGGARPENLRKQMDAIQRRVTEVSKTMETNIVDLEKQAEDLSQKMKKFQIQVIQVLESLMTKVSSDSYQLKKEYCTTLSDTIASCKSLMAAIASSCSLLESVLEHGTETQIFITVNKLEHQLHQYDKTAKELYAKSFTGELNLDISHDLEDVLKTAESKVKVKLDKNQVGGHADSRLHVATKYKKVKINEKKRYRWADLVHGKPSVSDCKMGPVSNLCIECGFSCTDLLYLPDRRLVVKAKHIFKTVVGKCILFNKKKEETSSVDMKDSSSSGLALINNSEIVYIDGQKLQCVSVGSTLSPTRIIPCLRKPICVATVTNSLVAVGWETGFGLIALDGKECKYIDRENTGRLLQFKTGDSMTVDNKRHNVYHSSLQENKLYGFHQSGKPMFTYTSDKLQQPRGLAVDRGGNVYVCSKGTGCVLQVCPAGILMSVIDTGLLGGPFSITFHPALDSMMAMNYSTPTQVLQIDLVPPM